MKGNVWSLICQKMAHYDITGVRKARKTIRISDKKASLMKTNERNETDQHAYLPQKDMGDRCEPFLLLLQIFSRVACARGSSFRGFAGSRDRKGPWIRRPSLIDLPKRTGLTCEDKKDARWFFDVWGRGVFVFMKFEGG